jgi:hypothetical protein
MSAAATTSEVSWHPVQTHLRDGRRESAADFEICMLPTKSSERLARDTGNAEAQRSKTNDKTRPIWQPRYLRTFP